MTIPVQDYGPPSDVERIDVTPVNKREQRSLYKARVKIHPRLVRGTFRTLKWWLMAVTLTIYYVVPWLRWDRGPDAPDQAVLIDFPTRKFYFFFIEIWPQEFFYIAGLLIMSGIGLFLVTSVAGRVWCGYFCPQTVWTDLFIHVERLIEGDRNARIKLDAAPMSISKLAKRVSKHAVWLIIALMTGGAWIFYFADAPSLARGLATGEAPMIAYVTVAVLTFTTYSLGGLMREQVCTYMCPWPRIQGAMMDEESMVVTYQSGRGEPRGSVKTAALGVRPGDCVDCNACVAACPMGIDIRDGSQLECITCALCIDACDDIMTRVKRPTGLIGYASLAGEARAARGEGRRLRLIRPRTIVYFVLWCLVGAIMLYALLTRADVDMSILHDRNPVFVRLSDGSIRNAYTVKVLNKQHATRTFRLGVDGVDAPAISVIGATAILNVEPVMTVGPDTVQAFRVLVALRPTNIHSDSKDIAFVLRDINGDSEIKVSSVFKGPDR